MNRAEFSAGIEANRPKLMKIAKSMVRSSDCEDAVQSAIAAAWEHLPQLRDKNAFDAWLVKILINRCRQIQRGYKKDRDVFAAVAGRHREGEEAQSDLREALEELSGEERRLILLHHRQGYTIKEISDMRGVPEDVLKMRLYRARKRLRIILISLLLLVLLASAAIGTGMIDVSWFLENRRAEPAAMHNPIVPESVEISYSGDMLEAEISDAVWNRDELSITFVYSMAGKESDVLVVHSGNIGVDGVRQDHIWTQEGIVPVSKWADGKRVFTFSVDGWRLNGLNLTGTGDYLPDGLGETFMAELRLDWITPDRYESLLDANGMLTFEADVTLKDYENGETLEAQKAVIRIGAPSPQEWRNAYEVYHR